MTGYGVRIDDRHRGYADFTVWSGPFMSTYEGRGILRDGAKRTTVITYNDDRVPVFFPEGVRLPRTEANFEAIDQAINDALNEYERQRGSIQIGGGS